MIRLSVNINKVATLRNTRTVGIPSPTRAAELSLLAGAGGITVHPRPDGRHILAEDVDNVARLMRHWQDAEFNVEGNPLHGLIDTVRRVTPNQVTLVPDMPDAFTSDQGWNLKREESRLADVVGEIKEHGARVSLFVDAVPETMVIAAATGADRVELYTEPYARAFLAREEVDEVVERYAETARAAVEAGLGINAGHDLNRRNLSLFLQRVPHIDEVSIGHALIADAIEFGLADTVGRYLSIIEESQDIVAGRGEANDDH